MKVLLPDTVPHDVRLPEGATVVAYSASATSLAEHADAEVFVAWGNTRDNLLAAARDLTGLRFIQTLAAGPDAVLAAGFGPDVVVASGRGLHDITVAEHTLALVLGAVRRLDRLRDSQRDHRWDAELVALQTDPATRAQYTLHGATVAIWGFGSIAKHLAPMLVPLGADVVGIATSAGSRDGFPVVAAEDADELLARTDVLISVLPHTAATEKLFDAELFGRLKPGAVFVNVGRGRTVDEDDLASALESGQLRAAAIDVTREEPLPSDSALWDAPNLLITPHVAGNRPIGWQDLLAANVRALLEGGDLRNVVAR